MASIASEAFCSLVTGSRILSHQGLYLENPRLGETGGCSWGMAFFLRTEYCTETGGQSLVGVMRGSEQYVKKDSGLRLSLMFMQGL